MRSLSQTVSRAAQPGDLTAQSGDFAAQPGDLTAQSGDYAVQSGDLTAQSGDFTVQSGDLTAQSGDFTAQSGDFTAQSGDLTAQSGDFTVQSGDLTAQSDDLHREASSALQRAARDPLRLHLPPRRPAHQRGFTLRTAQVRAGPSGRPPETAERVRYAHGRARVFDEIP